MTAAGRGAKRFYGKAEARAVEGGWEVLLDGKPLRTPGRAALLLPGERLARAIAAEWAGQGERVDPRSMPLTRLANTAIDRVAGREGAVAEEIASYGGSDLLFYRAESPEGLAAAQKTRWDPVLDWAERGLGARFVTAVGVIHVAQPDKALAALRAALAGLDPFTLAALHTITTLTGSALLALAHARGALSADEAWACAHVDEDWQISQWGEDAEAMARRARRREEMDSAARLLALLGANG